MARIESIATALPPEASSNADVLAAARQWLAGSPEAYERFSRFVHSAQNKTRRFALPLQDILTLGGLGRRAALFEELGVIYGERALRNALELARVDTGAIACHIFTSCTCPTIPAIDAKIIENAGLSPKVKRVPIYQQGCAGGVSGLWLAAELSKTMERVALTSVELNSLVFTPQDPSPAQLVGSAIFGDGAASAIISGGESGLVFTDTASYLIPNTRDLMGYDTFDDGFRLRLDRSVPAALVRDAPAAVESLLQRHGMSPGDINYWLFHPGGARILDWLEQAFCRPEQAYWAREVLRDMGNMSSASVLFVLERFLAAKQARDGDRIILLGVGPGLTLELILFEFKE